VKFLSSESRFYADQGDEKAANELQLLRDLMPAERPYGANQHTGAVDVIKPSGGTPKPVFSAA
jgi:hypothetical protein